MSNIREPNAPIVIRMKVQPSWDTGKEPRHIEIRNGGFFDGTNTPFEVPVRLANCNRVAVEKRPSGWVWVGYPVGKMY